MRNLKLLLFGITSLFHKEIKILSTLILLGFCIYYLGKQCANYDRRHHYTLTVESPD